MSRYDIDRPHLDRDGNEVTRHQLCRVDPAWASSRIEVLEDEVNGLVDGRLKPPGTKEANELIENAKILAQAIEMTEAVEALNLLVGIFRTQGCPDGTDPAVWLREQLGPCGACGHVGPQSPPRDQEPPIVQGALDAQAEVERALFKIRQNVGLLREVLTDVLGYYVDADQEEEFTVKQARKVLKETN